MAKVKSDAAEKVEIYQFHIRLDGISPMIWRRILIRSDSTIEDLHKIIQIVMNWTNYYLHQFTIHGKQYAVSRPHHYGLNEAKKTPLHDLQLRLNERFLYEYSFFEWWQHHIRLEKRLPVQPGKTYPVCIAGSGAAPPEDCGGIEGFMSLRDHFSQAYILSRVIVFLRYILHDIPPDEDEFEDHYDDEDVTVLARFRDEFRTLQYWFYIDKCDRQAINQRLQWYASQDERWMEGLDVI